MLSSKGGNAMEYMLMPLRRYADFSGRSRRLEFWMWQLFQIIVYAGFTALLLLLGGSMMTITPGDPDALAAGGGVLLVLGGLYLIYILAVAIPSLAVAVRRLHDTNRSGWWILAPLAPYILVLFGGGMALSSPDSLASGGALMMLGMAGTVILALVILVFYFLEGTKGPNKYGPDPKAGGSEEVLA
jgi:uncharacterized membrane protein YhaH (DUF805 family)